MKDKMPVFGGVAKGTVETPAVLMHSNVGITFDLQAIRDSMPGTEIVQFVGSAGLPDIQTGPTPTADVWVLVDGQKRFYKRGLTLKDGLLPIGVEIASYDRFLTLCVTDAAYIAQEKMAMDNDYVYFVEPKLVLKGAYELSNKE